MSRALESRDPGVEAAPGGIPWPCRLAISGDLQPFVQRAWDFSATFRDQCRRLAAARAVIVLRSTFEPDARQAKASIGSAEGLVMARVRIRPGDGRTVEHIAHELEHVLECVEGINYLLQSRSASVRLMPGGAFETRRAIDSGERVAREVEEATRVRRHERPGR